MEKPKKKAPPKKLPSSGDLEALLKASSSIKPKPIPPVAAAKPQAPLAPAADVWEAKVTSVDALTRAWLADRKSIMASAGMTFLIVGLEVKPLKPKETNELNPKDFQLTTERGDKFICQASGEKDDALKQDLTPLKFTDGMPKTHYFLFHVPTGIEQFKLNIPGAPPVDVSLKAEKPAEENKPSE